MSESISKNNELENEMTLDMSYFWYSDVVSGAIEMFLTQVIACSWRCANSWLKDPSGARRTPRVCFPQRKYTDCGSHVYNKIPSADWIYEAFNNSPATESGMLWPSQLMLSHWSHMIHNLYISSGENKQSRSEERRVGKECSDECRSRWSPYH